MKALSFYCSFTSEVKKQCISRMFLLLIIKFLKKSIMKNLFTALILVCSSIWFTASSQPLIHNENIIEKIDLAQELSKEELVELKLNVLLDKHHFIDKVESKKLMNSIDWIKMYNIIFPEEFDENAVYSPGKQLRNKIKKQYSNSVVLVSFAKEVSLPSKASLTKIQSDFQNGIIETEAAEALIKNIPLTIRFVYGAGLVKPIASFGNELNIIAPKEFQFLDEGISVSINNEHKDIVWNTSAGLENVPVTFLKEKELISVVKTKLFSKEDASKYKKRANRDLLTRSNSGQYNVPYYRNFSTTLTTGLPCQDGCAPGSNLMQGQTLIIEGNDCVLDKIIMITDGIDYRGRDVDEILELFGGVERFRFLLDFGFDIMIVDWPSQMGWIENNSAYFQSMVEELNAEEDFDRIEMVLGISMGGIITRHALIEMELNQTPHNINNWVAGDSPLEGSNLSIGVQALIREMDFAPDLFIAEEQQEKIEEFVDIINSPAARQLLSLHLSADLSNYTYLQKLYLYGYLLSPFAGHARISPAPDPLHIELQEYFSANGSYPQLTVNNVTIADGSSEGIWVNEPGNTILDVELDFLGIGGLGFLKTFASNGLGNRKVLKKKYPITATSRYTRLNFGIQNIDCAPGSFFPTNGFDDDGFNWPSLFSHATTTSALGIPGDPQNTDLSTSPFLEENIFNTPENMYHSSLVGEYGEAKMSFLVGRLDPDLLSPNNFIVLHQPLQFHFENNWGAPKTDFCIDDEVYLDGSLTTNQMQGYQLTLYIASSNQEVAQTPINPGSPSLVNITHAFMDAQPNLIFQPIEYRVKLEIFTNACGAELEKEHVFSFRECCTPNPLYPPSGPENIWIEDGNFHWDEVGGATQYRIDFGFPPGYDGPVPPCGCGISGNYPTIYGIEGTTFPIPDELINSCFFWSVRAYCPESGWSQPSGIKCYSTELMFRSTVLSTLEIFPNPANSQISVRFNHADVLDFEVYNNQGKLVLSALNLSGSDILDISTLPVGMYILKNPDNRVNPVRFIRQ